MKYTTLLIDNDNTIMDFLDAERQGIRKTFLENGVPYSEEILAVYSKINDDFWKMYERGEIAKSEIYKGRFYRFTEVTGIKFDVDKIASDYLYSLSFGTKPMDGAIELLTELYGKYDMYVATNGERKTQIKRITDSGLSRFFTDIFVSETTGFQKPEKGYFTYVFEHIKEKDKSKVLMIGDSLSSDIKGGIAAGIDTCWYNTKNESSGDIHPTYEVYSLGEILKIL